MKYDGVEDNPSRPVAPSPSHTKKQKICMVIVFPLLLSCTIMAVAGHRWDWWWRMVLKVFYVVCDYRDNMHGKSAPRISTHRNKTISQSNGCECAAAAVTRKSYRLGLSWRINRHKLCRRERGYIIDKGMGGERRWECGRKLMVVMVHFVFSLEV